MNRHYNRDKLRQTLGELRQIKRKDGVNLNIGADIIAWFPWETEEDFQDTLSIINDFQITQLHAFPFSWHIDHYNVPAWSFPNQVPNHIAQNRTKILLEHGEQQKKNFTNGEVWKTLKVLIEKLNTNWSFSGWSENYLACNEKNFIPDKWQTIARWKIVSGKYLWYLHTENEIKNDD